MLLGLSILGFGLANALFIYLFDHFMGQEDTPTIVAIMAGMHGDDLVKETEEPKRLGAAGSGS